MKPYYQDDAVTIYHGDCRTLLPFITADSLVSDPPYGVNLKPNKTKQRANYLHKNSYLSYDDTPENFLNEIIPAIITSLSRTRRGLVFCGVSKVCHFPEPAAMGGIFLPSGCGRTAWGFTQFSPCLLYGQAPEIHKGCKPTVLRSTVATEDNGHPCPKPIEWMTWAVNLSSIQCETILDPFMGSGTTLRAAKDLGRKAIGIEIEEKYCEIAAKRMAQEVFAL